MARLVTHGWEIALDEQSGSITSGSVTRDTTLKRSGLASAKCDSAVGNVAASYNINAVVPAISTTYYYRAYFCFTALPASTVSIFAPNNLTGLECRMNSTGNVGLFNGNANTQIGSFSSTAVVADGVTWYRIEMQTIINASGQVSGGELQLDGSSVAIASGLTLTLGSAFCFVGWIDAPGASKVVNVDDFAVNDNTGGTNNSWCGSGKVILMLPISDNARGAFTGGAAGTTNLWDAVNNTPPVGVADSSATNTSQIKNKTATNPTSCDLNLATYTAAGIGASDTVNAIQVVGVDGEDPVTGTKVGAYAMVSNPVIAAASFNYGDDGSIQGTYLGNWRYHLTAIAQAPSVTLGTAPVIRVTCTSGATTARAASCCFLGSYVDYTPFVASPNPPLPVLAISTAMHRAANFMKSYVQPWRRRIWMPV